MSRNEKSSARAELHDLATALSSVDEPQTMLTLMEEVLTPSERRNLALRWRLMQMLRDGVTQRAISDELGISLCKITRGSRILKNPDSVAAILLKREKKETC